MGYNRGNVTLYDAIAAYLEVDEAEVIDNGDNETVTVFENCYQIVFLEEPVKLGDTTYYWVLLQLY